MCIYIYVVVGGFRHELYFPFHMWDVMRNPLTKSYFFKMVKTTNQYIYIVSQDYLESLGKQAPQTGIMIISCISNKWSTTVFWG